MIVTRFFEPILAQTSYLIGCASSGEALIIDPNRDVEQYVRAAAQDNLRIAYVTETHIHADFLSGARELARHTGATLLLSDEGDADWKYGFGKEARLVKDGDRLTMGRVHIDVVHTPGHTPEHVTFLITDGAAADRPIAAATGDFIFAGDVGRPDLLEKAAKVAGTMEQGAKALYKSLRRFDEAQEEWLQIWPGHGAGSACGKGISAIPYTTLGYERRFNWAFKAKDEGDFVRAVLEGQPDPPTYFATMKRINRDGPPMRSEGEVSRLPDEQLARVVQEGGLVIDARAASEYAAGFVPGTINIPLNNSFVTWAGWLVPYDTDIHLIVDRAAERADEAVRALSLIGLDRVVGVFDASAVGRWAELHGVPGTIPQVAPADLAAAQKDRALIDVRTDAEWKAGHLPGAIHIPLGHLMDRLDDVPAGTGVIMQCQSGARSSIAASLLRRAGFSDVANLAGGYLAATK